MITINKIFLDSDAQNLLIDVETSAGHIIKEIKIAFENTSNTIFTDPVNDETNWVVSVPASVIQKLYFEGLYFITFKVMNEDTEAIINYTYPFANLSKYVKCLLNILDILEIKGCGEVINKKCQDCNRDFLLVDSLIHGTYLASANEKYSQASFFVEKLNNICQICNTCPNSTSNLLMIGQTTFGVIDDKIVYGS